MLKYLDEAAATCEFGEAIADAMIIWAKSLKWYNSRV